MNGRILTFRRTKQFTNYLLDDPAQARRAASILKAILQDRSPRLSHISQAMPGKP